jgi:hypothetical protein
MQMNKSMDRCCIDSHRAKHKYSETYPSQCQFVHYIFHTHWPGIEPGPPQWQTGGYPPPPCHGPEEWTSFVSYTPHRKHSPSQLWTNRLMLQEQSRFNTWGIRNRLRRSNVVLNARSDGECT